MLPQRAVHDYRPIVGLSADHKWVHGFTGQPIVASAEARAWRPEAG